MDLLVLGGTRFVGAAVVADALARGWQVTAFNRGETGALPAGVRHIRGDRTRADDLAVLGGQRWDAVVDTWAGAPRVVRDAAEVLAPAVGRYGYVSSRSVYRALRPGGDESDPPCEAGADADATDYAADKRGGELAAERAFGPDRVLEARAGLILGPREDIGRLPWWLARMQRGGAVLAPGPRDLPLQYVDARDLAAFVLDALSAGRSGPYDVVSRPGHTTTQRLLDACAAVTGAAPDLVWVDPQFLLDRGVEPWVELPIWIPREHEEHAVHESDTSKAHRAGLRCRPVEETVADTWHWLTDSGFPAQRPDRPKHGIDPDRERALLAEWARPVLLTPGGSGRRGRRPRDR